MFWPAAVAAGLAGLYRTRAGREDGSAVTRHAIQAVLWRLTVFAAIAVLSSVTAWMMASPDPTGGAILGGFLQGVVRTLLFGLSLIFGYVAYTWHGPRIPVLHGLADKAARRLEEALRP